MREIIGVTFPIPYKYMGRFFEQKKDVFIKPANCFKELKPGMKLVFYQSHKDTGYVGEGIIQNIHLVDDPLSLFEMYGERIFLTREEVKAYQDNLKQWKGVRVRKDNETKKKKWMCLELKEIKRYKNFEKPERFVPVGGQYIRTE